MACEARQVWCACNGVEGFGLCSNACVRVRRGCGAWRAGAGHGGVRVRGMACEARRVWCACNCAQTLVCGCGAWRAGAAHGVRNSLCAPPLLRVWCVGCVLPAVLSGRRFPRRTPGTARTIPATKRPSPSRASAETWRWRGSASGWSRSRCLASCRHVVDALPRATHTPPPARTWGCAAGCSRPTARSLCRPLPSRCPARGSPCSVCRTRAHPLAAASCGGPVRGAFPRAISRHPQPGSHSVLCLLGASLCAAVPVPARLRGCVPRRPLPPGHEHDDRRTVGAACSPHARAHAQCAARTCARTMCSPGRFVWAPRLGAALPPFACHSLPAWRCWERALVRI
jgi:hypothetical protein